MIGITPQGSISYISTGWGGRTTDRHIVENSNFLDYLLPGDLILAGKFSVVKSSKYHRSDIEARENTELSVGPSRSIIAKVYVCMTL